MNLEQSVAQLVVPVTDSDHIRGPVEAAVTLVEYGDYECPWCLRAHPILDELRQRAGEKFRLVFRHFPQSTVHRNASVAAQAAEAAGAQGKFWEMHDLLYQHQDELSNIDYTGLAVRLGLEIYRFSADLGSGRYAPRVQADHDGGVRSGVAGTPTFFLNGRRLDVQLTVEALLTAIDAASRESRPQ